MPLTNQSTPKAHPEKTHKRKVVHQEQSRPISPPPDGAQSSPSETKQSDSHTQQSTTKANPNKVRRRKCKHSRSNAPALDPPLLESSEVGRKRETLPETRPSDLTEGSGPPPPSTPSVLSDKEYDSKLSLLGLQKFFNTTMPVLKKAKGHTPNGRSRTPGYFDKHLEDSIKLKRVVHLPSIAEDLELIAKQAILDFPKDALPPPGESFLDEDAGEDMVHDIETIRVQRESNLEDVYAHAARHCAKLAGIFAYPNESPVLSSELLSWTSLPMDEKKDGPAAKNQATPDAVLNLSDSSASDRSPKDVRRLISEYKMSVLVTAEFKNLNFVLEDDGKHMHEIVHSYCKGAFPWVGCELGARCAAEHKVKPTSEHVSWDAENHPCHSIQVARKQVKLLPANKEEPASDQQPRDILQQAWASAVRYDNTFIMINAGNAEILAIRDRQTQTLYVSDVIDVGACENYLQMHTGLFLAAIRDAEDRARVRSTRKEKPPTWTPVDTGVLDLTKLDPTTITAELLGVASTREWLKITPDKRAHYNPFTTQLYHRIDSPDDIVLTRSRSPSQARSPSPSNESPPNISEELYKFIGSSGSMKTEFSAQMYGIDVAEPAANTCFELQAEFSSLGGHRTYRAALRFKQQIKKPRSVTLADFPVLVIKSASEPQDIDSLQDEYRVIDALRQKNVEHIPETYWLFHCPHPNNPFVALVLEDMGSSLADMIKSYRKNKGKRAKIQNPIAREDVERFNAILKCWHRAGYIHTRLSYKQLMFRYNKGGSEKTLSIVGFHHAEYVGDLDSVALQATFDENEKELLRLLEFRVTK